MEGEVELADRLAPDSGTENSPCGAPAGRRCATASIKTNGAPAGTRTPNLLIRSQVLYPIELRARTARNAFGVAVSNGAG